MPAPRRTPHGSRSTDTSMHRPKSPRQVVAGLIIMLLLVSLIPAVSAEIIEGQIHDVGGLQTEDIPAIDIGTTQFIECTNWRIDYNPVIGLKPESMHFLDVQLYARFPHEYTAYPNYQNYDFELKHINTKVANVKVEVFKGDWVPSESNPAVGKTYGSMRFTFSDWNYTYLATLTDKSTFTFGGLPTENRELLRMVGGSELPSYDTSVIFYSAYDHKQPSSRVDHHVYYYEVEYFTNNYTISTDEYGTDIYITRIFGDDINPSKIIVSKSDGTVLYESPDYETANRGYAFPYGDLIIDIEGVYGVKYRILGDTITPPDSTPSPVTVYVRNSQTGALLSDSHIVISASVDGEFHEVINQTLPSGIYNGPLQPTGGGMPNPDYYRLVASADGYNPIMPYMDFEHGSATTLFVEMEPTTGGPEDDNKTFIEFYVRDTLANGISGATVTCGPYTLITNSAGYTQFEMPVNATYPYSVSKSGYITIEGRVTVADGPRYVVNVVLGPGTVPTHTPGPGETPTSTPTPTPTGWGPGQWTPDPDESLGDNARGAAKQTLLEGLQAGQLLFTLCILVLIMAVLDSRRR